MKSKYFPNDSIVSFDDAEAWSTELIQTRLGELEGRLLELEPAVVGLAQHQASRLKVLLMKAGVDPRVAGRAADEVTRAGVMCAELTRRGYGKFLADLIGPGQEDHPKEADRE